jgi:hypothetical protein
MFVCYDCEKTFNEPKIWTETHGLDTGPYENLTGCPYCGGAFAETYRCDSCNEWIIGPYIKLNSGERICEECYTAYEIGEE